jgi:hypothetical protein
MIPAFERRTGNLPAGVHSASWDEFQARFGATPYRRSLVDGLLLALEPLYLAGCQGVYVDGSFVTAKPVPGDFDACWDSTGVDLLMLQRLEPAFSDLTPPRTAQKQRFKGEFFPAAMPADTFGRSFLEFFQFYRQSRPKGIVLLQPGGAA